MKNIASTPKCYQCGAELVWQSDNSYEDCGIDITENGNGTVRIFECEQCGSYYEIAIPNKNKVGKNGSGEN